MPEIRLDPFALRAAMEAYWTTFKPKVAMGNPPPWLREEAEVIVKAYLADLAEFEDSRAR